LAPRHPALWPNLWTSPEDSTGRKNGGEHRVVVRFQQKNLVAENLVWKFPPLKKTRENFTKKRLSIFFGKMNFAKGTFFQGRKHGSHHHPKGKLPQKLPGSRSEQLSSEKGRKKLV